MNENQKPLFKRQKSLNFWILGLGYGIFYYSRYNLSTAHAEIARYLKWEYSNYGKIMAFALFIYGLNVLIAGPICDTIGGKKSMMIGAAGSLFSNLLFGATYYLVRDGYTNPSLYFSLSLSNMFVIMTTIWTLNYYFQSYGALSIVKINSAWNKKEERGSYAGKFGVLLQIGRALVLITCPWILVVLKWPFVFFIPAAFQALMLFLVWRLVQNSPEDIGIDYKNQKYKHKSLIATLKEVLSIKSMIFVIIIALVTGMMRGGIEHYVSRFFIDQFKLESRGLAQFFPYIVYSIMMPIMMMLASIIAGMGSDKYLKSKRFPIILGGFILATVFLFCLSLDMKNALLSSCLIIMIMASLQGVNNILMGVVPADLGHSRLSASITGILDGTQYWGGSGASLVIGMTLTATHSWKYWPIVLIPAGVMGIILATMMVERENDDIKSKSI